MKLSVTKRNFTLLGIFLIIATLFYISPSQNKRNLFKLMKSASKRLSTATRGQEAEITKPLWVLNSVPMQEIDENTIRCKGEDMGCFKLLTKTPQNPVNKEAFSKDRCLRTCFQRSDRYAGLQKNGICYCKNTFGNFVADKNCPASCSAQQNCSSNDIVRIFMKTLGCQKGFSAERLDQLQVGCMEIPLTKPDNFVTISIRHSTSPQQCILNCEQRSYTFALQISELNACVCSDGLSLFKTARNMQSIMRACTNDSKLQVGSRHLHPVYRTFVQNENCIKKFFPSKKDPLTILTSLPGSGNTWVRHLIEAATGIYTGSFYNDGDLYNGGLIGENEHFLSGRTIAIKDHLFNYNAINKNYQSAILVVRNLYKAVLAEFMRIVTMNHKGVTNPNVYKSEKFKKFARTQPKFWAGATRAVFEKIGSILRVYYEDIVLDPLGQIERIVNFYPDDLIDRKNLETRLMCMNLDLTGSFKRPPKKLEYDPFDGELRKLFDSAIEELNSLMKQYKHPPLPSSYFNTTI